MLVLHASPVHFLLLSSSIGAFGGFIYGYNNYKIRPRIIGGVTGGVAGGITGFFAPPFLVFGAPVIIPYVIYKNLTSDDN